VIEITLLPEDSGKKLHRFVRQALPGLPLSGVYKMIRVGRVKVNGKKGQVDTLLQPGDCLSLYIHQDEYAELAKSRPKFGGMRSDIDIVYEDAHLLVVNKPVDLLTHPDSSEHKDTLINRALSYLYRRGEIADSRSFLPATVNRLDRNTSGIVLIGKDTNTLRTLAEAIRDRRVEKTYLAVVWGKLAGSGAVDKPLLREEWTNRTVGALEGAADGRSALTRYLALGSAAGFTLVEIALISGRTHQIRAHMQAIGHPLLGDSKYGGKPAFDLNHQLLHAYTVKLPDGRLFVADPPADFLRVLAQTGLKRHLQSRPQQRETGAD